MKTGIILLCCFMCTACVTSLEHHRDDVLDYSYRGFPTTLWETKRDDADGRLYFALSYMKRPYEGCFFPDSVVSDSVIPDKRIVNGGEMHCIKYKNHYYGDISKKFYYRDRRNSIVEVERYGTAPNGQPVVELSYDDYYYIGSDGLIKFKTSKFIQEALWYANVFFSPFLWYALLLYLIYRWIARCFSRLHKRQP